MTSKKTTRRRRAPRTIRVEVLVRSPYGAPGDIVRVDPEDSRIQHYLAVGVLRRV